MTFKMVNEGYKLCIILACFFSLLSCSEEMTDRGKGIAKPAYTAEDYFRAVYFIDGPLATTLGDYQKLSASQFTDEHTISKAREQQGKVLQYIREKHSQFFAAFQQKVTSGDYNIVEAAVKEGIEVYKEALKTLPEGTVSYDAVTPGDNITVDVLLIVCLYNPIILYPGIDPSEGVLTRKGSYSFEDYVSTITTGLASV